MAELVYARDSKSRLARDGGSSPLSGTMNEVNLTAVKPGFTGGLERRSGYQPSMVGRESVPRRKSFDENFLSRGKDSSRSQSPQLE
ncbi:MAG: hypothetical protein QG579_209 [Patescibacteria group bacterium]|nr:hypothetical protein [Patescibacteria group bacterium]